MGTPDSFTAFAVGDLDCDGDLSTYSIYAEGNTTGLQVGDIIKNKPLE